MNDPGRQGFALARNGAAALQREAGGGRLSGVERPGIQSEDSGVMRGRPRSGAPDRARRATSVRASLVCALVAAAAGCRGPEGPDAVELAERATSSGDWERAAELWYAVHRSEPEKTERSYHETARALFESGDVESACALLERGLEELPRSAPLLELHGELLER